MKVTKSQKRLLVILAIVILYGIIDVIKNKDEYAQVYLGKKKVEQPKLVSKSQPLLTKNERTVPKIDLSWKRDPFVKIEDRPVRKMEKVAPKIHLKLNALTYADENSFVMINDVILKEGEMIEGYRVDKISQNRVKLTKNGRSIFLNAQ
jgi:hypothetical protein